MKNQNSAVERAMSAAVKMGLDVTKARPHTLMLVAKLDNSESKYNISLRDDIQSRLAPGVARGLLDRDAFVASDMAIGILPVPVIGGKEYFTAAAPVFHPDVNIFDEVAGATHALSEKQALEAIYLGDHTLKTNEGIRIDKNPNIHFRTVEQTQQSASTANMMTGLYMKDIGSDVRFGGGDENEIIIGVKCDDKTLIGGTADRSNYIIILLYGAIVKGGTTKTYLG